MKVPYWFETWGTKAVFALFRAIGLDNASALGGGVARLVGPFTPPHFTALSNLRLAMPELSRWQRLVIVWKMWNHLGRVVGEMAWLPRKELIERVEIKGAEHLNAANTQAIFISGHFGNWELTYPIGHALGHKIALIYRSANNPDVDTLVQALRAPHCSMQMAKGKSAVRLAQAIRQGLSPALLIDQRMSSGVCVPFFGHPALTTQAAALLSLRNNLPIFPARVVRTKGAHFQATLYPPIEFTPTGDEEADILALTAQINLVLEGWVREYPEQWFWVHKRWRL